MIGSSLGVRLARFRSVMVGPSMWRGMPSMNGCPISFLRCYGRAHCMGARKARKEERKERN